MRWRVPVLYCLVITLINRWRNNNRWSRTWLRRPGFLESLALTDDKRVLLAEFQQEHCKRTAE